MSGRGKGHPREEELEVRTKHLRFKNKDGEEVTGKRNKVLTVRLVPITPETYRRDPQRISSLLCAVAVFKSQYKFYRSNYKLYSETLPAPVLEPAVWTAILGGRKSAHPDIPEELLKEIAHPDIPEELLKEIHEPEFKRSFEDFTDSIETGNIFGSVVVVDRKTKGGKKTSCVEGVCILYGRTDTEESAKKIFNDAVFGLSARLSGSRLQYDDTPFSWKLARYTLRDVAEYLNRKNFMSSLSFTVRHDFEGALKLFENPQLGVGIEFKGEDPENRDFRIFEKVVWNTRRFSKKFPQLPITGKVAGRLHLPKTKRLRHLRRK
jgi:hypothetical protein